jgi:hypothetical protein
MTPAILAQLPNPTPSQLGTWLVCLAATLFIIDLARRVFVRKPPVEAEFATKAELASLKSEILSRQEKEYEKLDAALRNLEVSVRTEIRTFTMKLDAVPSELNLASERRATEIHKRVNELERLTGKLEGVLSQMEAHANHA